MEKDYLSKVKKIYVKGSELMKKLKADDTLSEHNKGAILVLGLMNGCLYSEIGILEKGENVNLVNEQLEAKLSRVLVDAGVNDKIADIIVMNHKTRILSFDSLVEIIENQIYGV